MIAPDGLKTCPLCGRTTKRWSNNICRVCADKKRRMNDLATVAKYGAELNDEEKVEVRSVFDEQKAKLNGIFINTGLTLEILEEAIIRLAAGQYPTDVTRYIRQRYHIRLPYEVIDRFFGDSRIRKVLKRLRFAFEDKLARALIPITNPSTLAYRLEALYLAAEARLAAGKGSIRECVLVLKTASEILALETAAEKPGQTNNFLTIIQNIQEKNQREREVRLNLSANSAEKIEDVVIEQPSFIESDRL